MSRFLTVTDVRILRGQFREGRQLFKLLREVHYASDLLRTIVKVPRGYVTDFASVPRLPLTWLVAGGTGYEAAVVRDWLYTTHAVDGKAITRAQADDVFKEAIGASQDTNAPAGLMWLAVRAGGRGAWGDDGPEQAAEIAAHIEAQQAISAQAGG